MKIPQKIIPVVAFAFLFLYGYGQETLSIEREREIKTTGGYYFAECTAFEESVAKECALRQLTEKVIASLLQQSIRSEKPEEMQKIVEMRANMAQLPIIGRVQILAWVSKDSVLLMPANDVKSKTKLVIEAPEKVEPAKVEPAKVEVIQENKEPVTVNDNSSIPSIANPVIQDLSTSGTLVQFERKADGWARQGKLIYSSRKTAFVSPNNCHIAIFSSSRTLIALLGEGNASRTNLLTGETIQNPEQHYSGNQIIWIQIN